MIDILIRLAAEIAAGIAIAWVLRRYVFAFILVKGHSMNPTLKNGEVLTVRMCRLRRQALQRGQVVICHFPGRGRRYFIKRLVGMPGDTVSRVSGVTLLNGESLDARAQLGRGDYEYVLGEDEYFCVGDNRANSHDSRDWQRGGSNQVGPIKRSMICGVARRVIFPVRKKRRLENEFIYNGVLPVIAPEAPEDEGDIHEFQEEGTD